MAAGLARGFADFLHRGVGLAEADIVQDGVLKQVYVLKHHADVAQQAVAGVFPHVAPAEQHPALLHVPEPGDQAAQGRLAAAGRPDDRGGRPLRDHKIDPFEEARPVVGKHHILHADVEGLRHELFPALVQKRGILQGFHAIQRYGNDAGQRGNAAHHFDVRVQHEAGNHEQQAFDQIHIAAQVQQPRREEHAERRHLEHQLVGCGQRGEGTLQIGVAGAAGFDGLVHRPVGAVPKPERLHHGHTLNIFQNRRHQPRLRRLAYRGELPALPLHGPVYEQGHHEPRRRDQASVPIVPRNQQSDGHRVHEAVRHLVEDCHGVGFDLAERGGERGCQLAEPILAEIAERHALEDFPHFNALVRAHIVAGEHTAFRGPLSEYDFPGDAQAHKPARRGNGEPATAGRGQHGLQRHHDGEHRNDFRNGVQHPVAKGIQQILAATA